MSKNADEALRVIDVGLQSSPESDMYSDVAPVISGRCSRCDRREPVESSDFCEPCRAYLLGDAPEPADYVAELLRHMQTPVAMVDPGVGWEEIGVQLNELGRALVVALQPLADAMLAGLRAGLVEGEQRAHEDDQLDALRMAFGGYRPIPPPERIGDGPTVAERLSEAARRGQVYLHPSPPCTEHSPAGQHPATLDVWIESDPSLWTRNDVRVIAESRFDPFASCEMALRPATVERIMAGLERFVESGGNCEPLAGPPLTVGTELAVIPVEEADDDAAE